MFCQYNNIYTSLYKYLKEKKKTQTDYWGKKKTLGTVPTVPINNCENLLCHYNNINVRLHQYLKEKKKTQTDYWKEKKKL